MTATTPTSPRPAAPAGPRPHRHAGRRIALGLAAGLSALCAGPQAQAQAATQAPAAQESPGSVDRSPMRSLTLAEALDLARRNNRDLQAARVRLGSAKADVLRAVSALLPRLAAQGRVQVNEPEIIITFPQVPGLMLPQQAAIVPRTQLEATITATLPLIAPPAYAALHGARRSQEAQVRQLAATEAQLLQSVASAFFAAAGSDELVAARRHAIEVAQKTLDNARARLEAGVVNRVEVTRSELALLQAQQRLLESEDTRGAAYRVLDTLVLMRTPFKVVPPEEPVLDARSDGELVSEALRQRPEVAALEANIRAAHAQVVAQGLRWLPTLGAFGNMRFTNASGFASDPNDPSKRRYDFYAAGLQLDWTLFDGLERDAQRQTFQAQADDARLRLKQLRDTIADDVQNARRQAVTRREGLKSVQRQVQLARETLDLVRIQHDAGTATQLDLLTAQDQLILAEVGLAQARFDLAQANIALRRQIGAPLGGAER